MSDLAVVYVVMATDPHVDPDFEIFARLDDALDAAESAATALSAEYEGGTDVTAVEYGTADGQSDLVADFTYSEAEDLRVTVYKKKVKERL